MFKKFFSKHAVMHAGLALSFSIFPAAAESGPDTLDQSCSAEQCKKNDLTNCSVFWTETGKPVSRKDGDCCQYTEVCHGHFFLRHNNKTRTPDWVAEVLTKEIVSGPHPRPDKSFVQDKHLPDKGKSKNSSYTNSGYARGHMAASADFSINEQWMRDTFVYSNAVPQSGDGFNSSIWGRLEDKFRGFARDWGKVIVFTGPIYQHKDNEPIVIAADKNPCGNEIEIPRIDFKTTCEAKQSNKPGTACTDNEAAIPAALFKVVYDPDHRRLNAYIMPNYDHRSNPNYGSETTETYMKRWRVSLLNVEDYTGYKFFPNFNRHDRNILKEHCTATFVR